MAPLITDIVIAPDLPDGVKVGAVLDFVAKLCRELDHGNNVTRRNLYDRLKLIFTKLQQDNLGPSNDQVSSKFVAILEEYWRHLRAYKHMSVIERLLNFRKSRKAIADVNDSVEELFKLTSLRADSVVDWRRQNEIETANQQQALEAIVMNGQQLLEEVHGMKEMLDSVVMLRAELEKMQINKSEPPTETQTAVKAALNTIIRFSNAPIEKTPEWFIPESNVNFVERPIGYGSFATIHRGKYREHAHVVVKLLLPGTGALDEKLQKAFRNEVELWHSFRHPHVIRMLGGNHAASRPFIVMEEARQGNMVDFLARASEHQSQTWRLLYEAAQGIEFLHGKKIAHADLKLNNILVSDDGKALVTDFGLSQIKNRSKSQSMTKTKKGEPIMGGLRWLAPERFSVTPQLASDVYSFAMTILEAFLGEPPYASLDDLSARAKIEKGELPLRPEGMSDAAWQLIGEMTVQDPRARITMPAVLPRLKALAAQEQEDRGSSAVMCGTCTTRQRHGAKFCDLCGIPVSEDSADALLRGIGAVARSPETKTRALQKLYRMLVFSASTTTIPRDDVNVLLAVATDLSNPMAAVYAFGCLRILSDSPHGGEAVVSSAFSDVQSALSNALRPVSWKDLVGSEGNQMGEELEQVEVVELLVRLGAASQSALRDRIPRLAEIFRGSVNDPRVQSAALAALVAVTQSNEENLSELRYESIGARVMSVLRLSSNDSDKTNAAMLLGGLTESVLGSDQHINADDVRVLIAALQGGDPVVQQYVAITLANIGKEGKGATLIGVRSGVALLIELMQSATSNVTLQCCALRALSQLVREPVNATVFIQAGGIDALQQFLASSISDTERTNSLSCLQQVVANSKTLGLRIASNTSIITACVDSLDGGTKEQRKSAVEVLLELIKTHKPAIEEIEAIDRGRGFRLLIALIKDGEPLAEATLLQAIKTLLRRTAGEREGEPND